MHRRRLVCLIGIFCLCGLPPSIVNGDDFADGVLPRSSLPYVARATILDHTGLGFQGVIQIKRGTSFFVSKPVLANNNEYVGVKTGVPNRVYTFTCYYRGKVASTTVQATNPPRSITFKYSADGTLRASR